MQTIRIKMKKLHADAKMPFYGSAESAGFDLYSVEEVVIQPGQRALIGTGIALEGQEGVAWVFSDRSGLGSKGIHHFGGLIDSDYRGEFKVILFNSTDKEFKIEKGDRLIQVVPTLIARVEFEEALELNETGRGAGAFHSTGRK